MSTQYRHTGGVASGDIQSKGGFNIGPSGPIVIGRSVVAEGDLIKTEYLFDIDGMSSVATDADVIGNGTDAAYIMKLDSVTGTNVQWGFLQCIELPTTGEVDIDIVASATEDLAKDDAGGSTKLVNTNANWTLNLIKYVTPQDLAAKPYLYLAVGTGSTPTAGEYGAGKFILTVYTSA